MEFLFILNDSPYGSQRTYNALRLAGAHPVAEQIRPDFNGLFSELLCLSHSETRVGEDGQDIQVNEGMTVTAFEEDVDDEGKPDNRIASGTVERSPNWLSCRGSRWVLRIHENGVRHESDLRLSSGQ